MTLVHHDSKGAAIHPKYIINDTVESGYDIALAVVKISQGEHDLHHIQFTDPKPYSY